MNKEDKLILGTLAGVDLVLSPEHYEEYKDTLNKQLEQKDKEIDRLNNIINQADTKNLELIQKINKIYDIIENKNITGIEARLLIQDILDEEE